MIDAFVIIWFVVILLAAVIEITTMDLTSVWFSVGALVAFVLALFGVNELVQILAFIAVSTLLILSVRPLVKNYFRTNIISTNADSLIGKVAYCTKDIRPGERGEVRIDGKIWTAITSGDDSIFPDDKVEVLAIEGNKLIVVKL